MGFTEPYLYETDEELIETALRTDQPLFKGITLDRLKREDYVRLNIPEDWRPFAEGGFPTPSGKAEFYSASLQENGFDPLPTHSPRSAKEEVARQSYPLVLITAKSLHFLNSSYAQSSRHINAEGEPRLEIHPTDADFRGLKSQDRVRVFNERGELIVCCSVSDRAREGVVAIPFGWWASLSPSGRSANTLVSDGLSDWGGTAALYDTFVQVEKAD
jgi:anaerobic selenocysteine-containing dehydrogenase